MWPLLALDFKASILLQPLTVLMKQTRQAVCAVKHSILPRCLWSQHTRWPRQVQSHMTVNSIVTLNFADGNTASELMANLTIENQVVGN
jgi:hypothetical protein